jgi:hypothetical protein
MAITSITQRGTTEDFGLQVARGQIPYHKFNFKFGFNPDVDDSLETVWSKGGSLCLFKQCYSFIYIKQLY